MWSVLCVCESGLIEVRPPQRLGKQLSFLILLGKTFLGFKIGKRLGED
jgi:hypothetical protein